MASSIAAVMSTSPTSGTLRIVLGPSPSIAATMCLDTAFFEPRTRISPRSGPDGSTCQVPAMQLTVRANPPTPDPAGDRAAGLFMNLSPLRPREPAPRGDAVTSPAAAGLGRLAGFRAFGEGRG